MLTHLAISGGGSSGIKFAGSLKYLEETNQLHNVTTILGTSIGAVIAVLLSYTTVDIIIDNIKYLQNSVNLDQLDLNLFITEYGLLSKKYIIETVENILKTTFKITPTFLELFKHSKKEVVISSFNLNKEKVVYFNYKTHPNMSILKALSLSINIPFVFEKEVFNDEFYIDAGLVMNNLSWEYFKNISKNNKLGIYLSLDRTITNISSEINLTEYVSHILKIFFKQCSLLYENTINLTDENIFVLKETNNNLSLSDKLCLPDKEKINEMLKYGYEEIQVYLKKKL